MSTHLLFVQVFVDLSHWKLVFTCSTRDDVSQYTITVANVQTNYKLYIIFNSFLERAGQICCTFAINGRLQIRLICV